jgi:hypothetical protein
MTGPRLGPSARFLMRPRSQPVGHIYIYAIGGCALSGLPGPFWLRRQRCPAALEGLGKAGGTDKGTSLGPLSADPSVTAAATTFPRDGIRLGSEIKPVCWEFDRRSRLRATLQKKSGASIREVRR